MSIVLFKYSMLHVWLTIFYLLKYPICFYFYILLDSFYFLLFYNNSCIFFPRGSWKSIIMVEKLIVMESEDETLLLVRLYIAKIIPPILVEFFWDCRTITESWYCSEIIFITMQYACLCEIPFYRKINPGFCQFFFCSCPCVLVLLYHPNQKQNSAIFLRRGHMASFLSLSVTEPSLPSVAPGNSLQYKATSHLKRFNHCVTPRAYLHVHFHWLKFTAQ